MKLSANRAARNLRSLALAAVVLPFVMIPQGWAEELIEAAEWIGEGHIMELAAAANALAIIP